MKYLLYLPFLVFFMVLSPSGGRFLAPPPPEVLAFVAEYRFYFKSIALISGALSCLIAAGAFVWLVMLSANALPVEGEMEGIDET